MGVDFFRQWINTIFLTAATAINPVFVFMQLLGRHVVRGAVNIAAFATALGAEFLITVFIH